MSASLVAVVFDHTALLALGAGNRLLAGLVAQAHAQPGRDVYAPALRVVGPSRRGRGWLITSVCCPRWESSSSTIPLPPIWAASFAAGVDWRSAQAIDAGQPRADWPAGRPVVITTPEAYTGWGVTTITLG